MRKFLRELFWKRCQFCNEKKRYFYWIWELTPELEEAFNKDVYKIGTDTIYEVCTSCIVKKQREHESIINLNA